MSKVCALLVALCLALSPAGGQGNVTIYRDAWGTPHVHGDRPADASFGFGYATAADHWGRLEENYLRATGRWAEVVGESGVRHDYINRALRIVHLSLSEYSQLPDDVRAICDGYSAGINHWLSTHRQNGRRLGHVEPWYPIALIRYLYFQQGLLRSSGVPVSQLALGPPRVAEVTASLGSNGWAIAPSRTRDGNALLFINPHLPWFGPSRIVEAHLSSADGWNFSGYTRIGFPFPYVGFNEHIGWVSTDNAADLADSWIERFDHPSDSFSYRYGAGYRRASTWSDSIRVRGDSGFRWQRVSFKRTHHGVILSDSGDRQLAVGLAGLERSGWLTQWYRMTRARTQRQLRAAMEPLAMQFGNIMSADRQGHIWFLYNGAIPRRDRALDWTRPVEGRDPRSDWRGVHRLSELPAILDPKAGWLANSNNAPWASADDASMSFSPLAKSLIIEGDNPRGVRSRQLLRENARWTFDQLQQAAFDTRVAMADSLLPQWLAASSVRSDSTLAEARRILSTWDGRADTDRAGMTLFALWAERVPRPYSPDNLEPLGHALKSAIAELTRRFGRVDVPWGTFQQLVRIPDVRGAPATESARLPLAGAPGTLGAILTTLSVDVPRQSNRDGTFGASYVGVVEFGASVRAATVQTFGASSDGASRHYVDQASLFARGKFKPAPLTLAEVRAAAVDSLILRNPSSRPPPFGRDR